jgi:hypothetical protein
MVFRRLEVMDRAMLRRVVVAVAARASLVAMIACAPYTKIVDRHDDKNGAYARRVTPFQTRDPIPLKPLRVRG